MVGKKVPIDTRQHSVNIMGKARGLRREKKHCDFLIKVGSLEIPAHRLVLCINSEFFDKMLSHPTVENESGVVEMKDVDPECASACIDHMYGEEVSIPDEKYEAMMFVATLMQLHTLRDGVISLLKADLDAKLFYVSRRIANMYELAELAEKCYEYAKENFASISLKEEFCELEKSFIKKMMKSEDVGMSEEEKLQAVLRWIKYDSKRRKSLMEMMKWIDLTKVSLEYRQKLIQEDPLMSNECLRLLCSSVIDTVRSSQDVVPKLEKSIIMFDQTSGHLQLWNPKTNTWRKMLEMHDDMKKKNHFTALAFGDHIYILLESRLVYRLRYSDETAVWERMADMIESHGDCPPAAVFSNSIYVLGGGGILTATVEKYCPEENKWKKLKNMPQICSRIEVVACQEYIYSFGGYYRRRGWVDSVERFEPTTSAWTEVSRMKEAKGYISAVESSGKIYLLGGYNGSNIKTVEIFDVQNKSCATLQPMKVARSWLKGYMTGSYLYVVGGYNSSLGSIEKYDVKNNEWEMVEVPVGMKLKIIESCQVGF